jgi:DNA polymerase IIIc chi subunit
MTSATYIPLNTTRRLRSTDGACVLQVTSALQKAETARVTAKRDNEALQAAMKKRVAEKDAELEQARDQISTLRQVMIRKLIMMMMMMMMMMIIYIDLVAEKDAELEQARDQISTLRQVRVVVIRVATVVIMMTMMV